MSICMVVGRVSGDSEERPGGTGEIALFVARAEVNRAALDSHGLVD